MSIPESIAALLASKVVAGTAAAGLAVASAAGITTAIERTSDTDANEAAVERLAELAEGEDDADVDTGAEVEDDTDVEEVDLTATSEDDDVAPADEGGDDEEAGDSRAAEVHEVLGGGEFTPADGADFGAAVSTQAREQEQGSFGRSVASAASRGASDRGGEEETEVEDDATGSDTPAEPETTKPDTPAEQSDAAEGRHDRADEARADAADRPAGERGRP